VLSSAELMKLCPLNICTYMVAMECAIIGNVIIVNCWPQEAAGGSCDVNIEYELLQTYLELQEVTISIPLP